MGSMISISSFDKVFNRVETLFSDTIAKVVGPEKRETKTECGICTERI